MTADRVHIYEDTARQWRWRRVAPNGQTISASGEAFDSHRNAERAAARANPDTPAETDVPDPAE